MTTIRRKPLSYYLGLRYPFRAQVDEIDGYFVTFPDLPGCMTGSAKLEGLPRMIAEASTLWIETEYQLGEAMPLPTLIDYDEPSGKFNLRLPKALHRRLTEDADDAGVSLNQLVVSMLSAGDAIARVERRLDDVERSLGAPRETSTRVAEERGTYSAEAPRPAKKRAARKKAGRRTT